MEGKGKGDKGGRGGVGQRGSSDGDGEREEETTGLLRVLLGVYVGSGDGRYVIFCPSLIFVDGD